MELLNNYSVGVSNFVKRQKKGSGKTYSHLSFNELAHYAEINLNKNNYVNGYRDGVVLIPANQKMLHSFISPIIKINKYTKFETTVKKRRTNELNYISVKAINGTPLPLRKIELVLYRYDVLDEGNERSTDKDWELIAFFGTPKGVKSLPMGPVTMMRNQLVHPGGTKANYTSEEWALSTNFWQQYAFLK